MTKSTKEILEYVYRETMRYAEGISHTPSTIDPEYMSAKVFPDALAQLAELVRGEKKDVNKSLSPSNVELASTYYKREGFNEALEHIAQKLEGKNEL